MTRLVIISCRARDDVHDHTAEQETRLVTSLVQSAPAAALAGADPAGGGVSVDLRALLAHVSCFCSLGRAQPYQPGHAADNCQSGFGTPPAWLTGFSGMLMCIRTQRGTSEGARKWQCCHVITMQACSSAAAAGQSALIASDTPDLMRSSGS